MLQPHRLLWIAVPILAVPLVAFAGPFDLDTTFGAAGVVRVDVGTSTSVEASALQPDGKIVVAGTSDGAFLCFVSRATARSTRRSERTA